MKTVRSVTAAAVAAAMVATSVTPAVADGYRGGGYGGYGGGYGGYGDYGHRRHRDRIGAGEVIAGVAILGVIAAIAASGSKNRRATDGYRGGIQDENAAADACAAATERRGAQVTGIDNVYRTADGYSVRGTVSTGGGYDRYNQTRFTCEVRYGAVDSVRIDGGSAWRGY